jgi:hypothetical protein
VPTLPLRLAVFGAHVGKPSGIGFSTPEWDTAVIVDTEERLEVLQKVLPKWDQQANCTHDPKYTLTSIPSRWQHHLPDRRDNNTDK